MALVQLRYIINAIFKLFYWPLPWKNSTIIPLPKSNKIHSNPTNYRPISLLSNISKIAEKIILNRINKHIEDNDILQPFQFGFRACHNTTQQIARKALDTIAQFKKKVTSLVLLDADKAFDKVWFEGLIYKLDKFGFPKHLIQLIHFYINNRSFKVKNNNNTYSSTRKLPACVPQVSVLGLVLYILYLNDIPQFQQTNIVLFADDTSIYAHFLNTDVANTQTQIHLRQLENFWTKWRIKINPAKTTNFIFKKIF